MHNHCMWEFALKEPRYCWCLANAYMCTHNDFKSTHFITQNTHFIMFLNKLLLSSQHSCNWFLTLKCSHYTDSHCQDLLKVWHIDLLIGSKKYSLTVASFPGFLSHTRNYRAWWSLNVPTWLFWVLPYLYHLFSNEEFVREQFCLCLLSLYCHVTQHVLW